MKQNDPKCLQKISQYNITFTKGDIKNPAKLLNPPYYTTQTLPKPWLNLSEAILLSCLPGADRWSIAHRRCHLSPCGRTPPQCHWWLVWRGGLVAEQQACPVHSDGMGDDDTSHAREHIGTVMRSSSHRVGCCSGPCLTRQRSI